MIATGTGKCEACKNETRMGYINQAGTFFCDVCVNNGLAKGIITSRYLTACSVPFACQPDKTVVEKFTVEIQTPESPDYCACERCRTVRADFWETIIRAKLQHYSDHSDPLRVFPGQHKISVAVNR